MAASLESIVAATRRRISQRKAENGGGFDLGSLERAAAGHTPRGFRKQLRRVARNGIAVIAELKKASPSKGLIRADFSPSGLARELEGAVRGHSVESGPSRTADGGRADSRDGSELVRLPHPLRLR